MSLFFLSLLVRTLGPNGMGEWAMIIGAGTFLHSLSLNWMHAPAVRFGREEWSFSDSMAVTWASRWPFLLLGLLVVGALLLFDPFQWLTRFFHVSNELIPIVVIVMLGLWLSMETQNLLQVRGEFASLGYLAVGIDLASIVILLLLQSGMVAVSGVYTIILLLQGCNALLWCGALFRVWMKSSFHWRRPSREKLQRNLVYAWPLIPGFLLGFTSDWGDQLILRYYFTSREVGLFQSAYQLMMLLLGLSALIAPVLLPRLIDKNIASETGAKEFMIAAGPTTVALGLYLMIPTITVVPLLFPLFMGSQFTEASGVFIVLCAAVPGSLLSSFYGVFFNIQGRFWRSTVLLGGVKMVFNLTLSLLLVPRIGIMGSAIATAVSYGVQQCLYLYDQHHYYRIPSAKALVLLGVMTLFSITQALAGDQYLVRIVICCLGLMLLTLVIRKFDLLDRTFIMTLCAGRLAGIGRLILRIGLAR